MTALLVFVLSLSGPASGPEVRVRSEGGRFWIDCRSASLEEVLRKIAARSAMELWVDQGLSEKRVSAQVEAATLKQLLEEVFREVKGINYVLTFDPSNPEWVTKVYVGGGGGGRLGREPDVAASSSEDEPAKHTKEVGELPPELDPQALLGTPEAQETLRSLREFLERVDPPVTPAPKPSKPPKKEKPQGSQL